MVFNFFAVVMPVRKRTIIFESFNGKKPSDNPYYIWLELEKNPEIKKNWKVYWGIKKENYNELKRMYPSITFIPRFSFRWLVCMTTANYWVFNSRMPHWLKKNHKTIYIQTWHGTPLKRLGTDIQSVKMPSTSTHSYHINFVKETKRWDYLIAPNVYSREIFKESFKYENQFLSMGYPRNDKLVQSKDNEKLIQYLKKKITGKEKGKIFLYAPTWRDDYFISKGIYKFFMPFNLDKLFSKLDEDDILIIRPHYLVKDTINVWGYEDRVLICADEEINDLFLICDLLITDYSSVMFDYSILLKPILFYAYDFNYYNENLRGFYFDIEKEAPGKFVKTEEEFYTEIWMFNTNKYNTSFLNSLVAFNKKFNHWEDGNSSQLIAELILSEK